MQNFPYDSCSNNFPHANRSLQQIQIKKSHRRFNTFSFRIEPIAYKILDDKVSLKKVFYENVGKFLLRGFGDDANPFLHTIRMP